MADSSVSDSAAPVADNVISPELSPQEQLKELTAKATSLYAVKDYGPAAELYSQATELQAEVNGEMAIENADLLYAYGRCLFYVAQRTSTVLGGPAAQAQLSKDDEKKVSKKRKVNAAPKTDVPSASASAAAPMTIMLGVQETTSAADLVPKEDITDAAAKKAPEDGKPLFQFTGDENWADSSDEEDAEEEEGEGDEDEDDDFATAFELLDLARILYSRKLDILGQSEQTSTSEADKGKQTATITKLSPEVREVKSRVADIYDLQAEISLEGEKFSAAVTDLSACIELKTELEPPESSVLAECHYKLSLALEAAGQIQERDSAGNPVGKITIDWNIRNQAIEQLGKAIKCCELRVEKETATLSSFPDDGSKEKQKIEEQIEDVKEMIAEMQDRLTDLKLPPVSVQAETESEMNKELLSGILGQMLTGNASKEEQKEKLAEVMKGANDLSSMVKRKKPKVKGGDDTASNASGTSTKRKLNVTIEEGDDEEDGGKVNGKKVRIDG